MSRSSGGNDRQAVVFNKDSEQVVATLKGHQKKVTHVIHHFEEVSAEHGEKVLLFTRFVSRTSPSLPVRTRAFAFGTFHRHNA